MNRIRLHSTVVVVAFLATFLLPSQRAWAQG